MGLSVQLTGAVMVRRSERPSRRRIALQRFDRELSRNNYRAALYLLKQLKSKHGGLRAFGSAKLIPENLSILEKLEVDGTNLLGFQSLVDSIMDSIHRTRSLHSASLEEVEHYINSQSIEQTISLAEKRFRVLQHESGHFLVGYLLGVLPIQYQIPRAEALRSDEPATTGGVGFFTYNFFKEVGIAKRLTKDSAKIKTHQKAAKSEILSKKLDISMCVTLGGLVTDHMLFGYSVGLHGDVDELDRVARWLGLTETEANSHIKWAVCNTVFLLHRHREVRAKLAEAMDSAKPVHFCIETIENAIFGHET